ncbi:MAG: TetR/AcrR family transcriptional regulator [Clostridiales bacterium]|nr:TetR/AcrR family transcriptional regulator [Clostridiales bacterium]
MPPKAKFTRATIIAEALEIVRENGINAITSRDLGKRLGSSACPIFTVFNNMKEIKEEVIQTAKTIYRKYVNDGLKQELAFRGVGIAYIRFAIKEPKLFQLLFMSEQNQQLDLEHILLYLDDSYKEIIESIETSLHLSTENAKWLYQHLWIYTHGIATLCATKVCSFSDSEINALMTEVFNSLLKTLKKKN